MNPQDLQDGMNDLGAASPVPESSGADATQADPAAPSSAAKASEQCVPLSALSMPDDGEQMTPPAVGDVVNYEVEGKVSRIDGDMAYITPSNVNGHDVEAEAAEPDEPGEGTPAEEAQDAQGLDELQEMAKQRGTL